MDLFEIFQRKHGPRKYFNLKNIDAIIITLIQSQIIATKPKTLSQLLYSLTFLNIT